MPGIVLPSVVVSAGVAAFTTLAIEFAAKPWLEARKERILQQHRDRRELARKLMALDDRIHSASWSLRARTVDELLPGLIAASDALNEHRMTVQENCPPEIAYLIGRQVGFGSGLLDAALQNHREHVKAALDDSQSNDDRERQAADTAKRVLDQYVQAWFDIPVQYLRTPSSHFIRRWLLIRRARAEIRRSNEEKALATNGDAPQPDQTSSVESTITEDGELS